jgi:23S rRNA (adenine2503-C2)-methyltransferase
MWDRIKKISSSDTNVFKYVFEKHDAVVESVLYKYPTYEERTVICCSTQSGCPVGCRFCGAGDYFVRSLTAKEIVSQPIHLLRDIGIKSTDIKKLQIMFMSMGEPLLNYDELEKALEELYDFYPIAKLLISTSGPKVYNKYKKLNLLSQKISTIGLQFSVHESTDENRKKLIPSPTLKLEEINKIGIDWYNACGRNPFLNYCVHSKNNGDEDADRLLNLFNPSVWQATLSVICEREEHIAAANERQRKLAEDFSSKLLQRGYNVRVFNPAGQDDIGGGCGQLWFVQDWMRKNPVLAKPSLGFGKEKVHTPT